MNDIDIPTEEQAKAAMLAVPQAALMMRTAGDCVVKRMLANRQADELTSPEIERHEAKIRTLAALYGGRVEPQLNLDASTRWEGHVMWDAANSKDRQHFYVAILTGFSFCLTNGEREWVVVSRATFIYVRLLDVFKPVESFVDDKLLLVGQLACGAAVYLPVVGGPVDLFLTSNMFVTGVDGVAAMGTVSGSTICMWTAADKAAEQRKVAMYERDRRAQEAEDARNIPAPGAQMWRALQGARNRIDDEEDDTVENVPDRCDLAKYDAMDECRKEVWREFVEGVGGRDKNGRARAIMEEEH